MIKFLDLHQQYLSIQSEIDGAIASVLASTAFIGGKEVASFESEFAAYHQSPYAIGVANGTDALEIALEALNLPPNSRVLVPANSFIASSECVTRAGLQVVFCDCNPVDYTLSIADVKAKITPDTSAIIAVHLYGHPCDMDALLELANQHHLKIIEDCAQAHGATYKGKKVGGLGDISAFSFYPGKNLGAYGDAGMILTHQAELAKQCRMIANHGRVEKYNHEFEGRNSRLDGLQAAILRVKLRHLDDWIQTRRNLAAWYGAELSSVKGLYLPGVQSWANPAYHLFVVRLDQREALKKFLDSQDIETGVHYPIALTKLKAYQKVGQQGTCPWAESMDTQLLSIPMGDQLTVADGKIVTDAIITFFGRGGL